MVDIVAGAINDMIRRIALVPAVSSRVVYMYTQDELMNLKKELSIPCVGVLYGGLTLNQDNSRREVSHNLSCAIVLLGADLCLHDSRSQLSGATVILQDIRDEVRAEPVTSAQVRWRFESESPVELGNDKRKIMGYVQRWNTNVVLWP